ncbi:MAG: ABC transporter permease [Verrucomicrobia bacterium]|nr:ABC transporter permease [Verrucomicrobiota bacterium]
MNDLKFAFRQLLKHPGFTAVAVLTLALGIALNAAMFSVVKAFLFPPLPYANAEQLLILISNRKGHDEMGASLPDFDDWKQQDRLCQPIASFTPCRLTVTGGDQPVEVSGYYVSADAFRLTGIQPKLGRAFAPEEDRAGAERVVILSHELWQNRFGGREDLPGQTVKLSGDQYTVVGVMPPGLTGFLAAQMYLPLGSLPRDSFHNRSERSTPVVARPKPGVRLAEVQAQMDTITARLARLYPETNEGVKVRVLPLRRWVRSDYASPALVLLGAVLFVMLIACSNVANLLLARAASRQKEIGIRVALGASRFRVVRQLLTESLLLASLGGGLGIWLALWAVNGINALYPTGTRFAVDSQVLGFAALATLLTGLLVGLTPSLQVSKPALNETLKEGAQKSASVRGRRFHDFLVAGEIALALILSCGAGLLIQSFLRYEAIDKGYDPKNVLTVVLNVAPSKYPQPFQVQEFSRNVLTEMGRLPGVEFAAAAAPMNIPRERDGWGFSVPGWEPGSSESRPIVSVHAVSADYFRALKIPMVRGRSFTVQDTGAASAVVINERMAQRIWPDAEPIGQSVKLGGRNSPGPWLTVVGVTQTARGHTWYDTASDVWDISVPLDAPVQAGTSFAWLNFYARTASDAAGFAEPIRKAIASVDPDQPILSIRTMEEWLHQAGFSRRAFAMAMSLFGALSLLLAAVGIYSLISYAVSQRTREIGIRMALGAQQSNVLGMVLKKGMVLALIGSTIGLIGTFALTNVIASQLYGIQPTDPLTFAGVTGLLLGTTLLACYLPARRATQVDPMEALRQE